MSMSFMIVSGTLHHAPALSRLENCSAPFENVAGYMDEVGTRCGERSGVGRSIPEARPEPFCLGSVRSSIPYDRGPIAAARLRLRMAPGLCLLRRLALLGSDRPPRIRERRNRAGSDAYAVAGSNHGIVHSGSYLDWRAHSPAPWGDATADDASCMGGAGMGSQLFSYWL